jgi:hypothetical protein
MSDIGSYPDRLGLYPSLQSIIAMKPPTADFTIQ